MALFAALIGPLFVDWTSYRDSFEREASAYIGRPVTVSGKAGVRLLPTPVISFTDIRVGDGEVPDVEMEQFRAEVELAPLLKGEVRVIQMAMDHPRFNIDIASLVSADTPPERRWKLDPDRISLERLQIVEGSALIVDSRTGRGWRAEGLNAEVEADTLMGPGKIAGNLVLDGKKTEVTASFGRLASDNSLAAKATIRSPDYPVSLALDGTYYFPGANPLIYDGTATIEGTSPAENSPTLSSWADFRASGKVKLAASDVSFDEVQASYGAIERPLILVASGAVDFSHEPSFDVTLAARQIDIDRTLGGGVNEPIAVETALAKLTEMLPSLPLPPVPGELHLEAQGVMVGGGLIEGVEVDLSTAAEGWSIDNVQAALPGESHVEFAGAFGASPSLSFQGHARLDSKRPAGLAQWWRGEVGSATSIGALAVDAELDLSPAVLKASDLVVRTGAGTITGSIDARRFPNSDKFLVMVDLGADRAELAEARAIYDLLSSRTVAIGQIDQMTMTLRADVLTAGGVEARAVDIVGGLDQGRLNLSSLSVADLAGASIEARGSIGDPFGTASSGNVEASIHAEDFQGAADFLAGFAPESRLAQHLKTIAPIISPVNAEVSAKGGRAVGEDLALSVTGSFANTHVTLSADGNGSLSEPASLAGSVKLQIDGSDSTEVLKQLGLTPLPVRSGPLKLDASFDGQVASAGKLLLKGTIAGVEFDYAAETSLADQRVSLAGEFRGSAENIDPLLLLTGLALPGLGEGHAASGSGRLEYSSDTLALSLVEASFGGEPIKGELNAKFKSNIELSGALELDTVSMPFLMSLATGAAPGVQNGAWSNKPFTQTLPAGTAINLSLTAGTLDLGVPQPATAAQLDFSLEGDQLQADLTEAAFAGGSLTGSASAKIKDGEVDLSIRAGLIGCDLPALVWDQSGLPAASGRLDFSFDATGRGRSVAGIVATLNGNGSFSIDEGRLNSLNGEALTAVMAAAEGEEQPDEQKARETFAQQFGSGTLEFGRAAGSFSIHDGVMSIPTVSLAGGATTILAEGHLDLSALTVSSDWIVRTSEAGDGEQEPSVELKFSGPIAAPERRVELASLLNLLQSRFTQIQLDKIQEAELRNAEMERQRAAAAQEAAARRRDMETPAPQPDPAQPTTPSPQPRTELPASQLAPELLTEPAVTESVPNRPAVEEGPDLPPPPDVSAPVQLVPQAAPEPQRRRQRRIFGTAPTPAAPPAAEPLVEEYKTLPNGTIVKVR